MDPNILTLLVAFATILLLCFDSILGFVVLGIVVIANYIGDILLMLS